MSGQRLLKRLVSVLLGMLGFFLFLHAVDADAQTAVGREPSAMGQNERPCAIAWLPSARYNLLR